ncbi:MAG: HAD-IA family hydrolase [Myxococcales bacterium]
MAIEVVLFDLGGVLIELGGMADMADFADESDESELWRRWLACPWVRRFERGLCDSQAFAEGMVESWSMDTSADEFLSAFSSWPRGLFPGARELIGSIDLDRGLEIACFSNTNALHADHHVDRFGIGELFQTRFFSHEMGVLKPDREAFDFVVRALGRPAETILFLDDNEINVRGARAAGLRAERASGPGESRAILAKNGLLRA